jgi:hypothetical protein
VWRSAILEGEDVISGVVVAAEELALLVLALSPGTERGDRFPVKCDGLVRVFCLASRFVSGVPAYDHSIVVHGDGASVEVDGRPSEAADLAAPDTGRELQEE